MVGGILTRQRIGVRTARIATIGERAEDVFHLINDRLGPLAAPQREALQAALRAELADAG